MNYRSTPWVPVKGPKKYFTSAPGVQRCNTYPRPRTTGQVLKDTAILAAQTDVEPVSKLFLSYLKAVALRYDDRPYL